jgi:hypothetical protein
MVPPSEFSGLTAEEIDREVRERREMIGQMFGWLYPSILSGEIEELLRLRAVVQTRAAAAAGDGARRTDDNLRRVFG